MANAPLLRDAAVASLGPLREAVAHSIPKGIISSRAQSPRATAATALHQPGIRCQGKQQRPNSVPEGSGNGRAPSLRKAAAAALLPQGKRRSVPEGHGISGGSIPEGSISGGSSLPEGSGSGRGSEASDSGHGSVPERSGRDRGGADVVR